MAKLIIEVPTLAQAYDLALWYEGQGEQDANVWFETRDLKAPKADVMHTDGCVQILSKDIVVLYTK